MAAFIIYQPRPVLAKDKDHIELTCGTTKATITCTKFADVDDKQGVCVASTLAFDTADGSHIVSPKPKDVPQSFVTPTVSDGISCASNKKSSFFSITYSPGCDFAQCLNFVDYSKEGRQISLHGLLDRQYRAPEKLYFQPTPPLTLRENIP